MRKRRNGCCIVKNNRGLSQVSQVQMRSEVSQPCPTLRKPMDCSLPGSSIHGIFQARILEWVAISFSRGSSRPRDWTQVSHIVGRRFTLWATRWEGAGKPRWRQWPERRQTAKTAVQFDKKVGEERKIKLELYYKKGWTIRIRCLSLFFFWLKYSWPWC